MSFYKNTIYPHLVDMLGDPPPIRKIREQMIPLAEGIVLEIGVGAGANFPHYKSRRVSKLYALEPNPGMIRLAQKRQRRTNLNIEYLDLPGERVPLEDEMIDTVVSTFTLCTVPDIRAAVQGMKRVLKPQGKFIFFELGLSPDASVQHRQRQLARIYYWVFQGLYLTRDIPALIVDGGFQIQQMDQGYLASFPKSASYCWWGIAQPAENSSQSD